jgi:UDP-N-acetylglucosamine:LPS N-acetylglucosamine transferase
VLADLGMAEILTDKEIRPEKVWATIEKMLANLAPYKRKAIKSKSLVKKDAAQQIVALVEKMV